MRLTTVMFLIMASQSLGGTYFVSADAEGGDDGSTYVDASTGESSAGPWTLAESIANATSGDVINLEAGIYNTGTTAVMYFSGRNYTSETIWQRGPGQGEVIVTSDEMHTLMINSTNETCKNITINGIYFSTTGNGGIDSACYLISSTNAISNILFNNCFFSSSNTGTVGIRLRAQSANIENLTFADCSLFNSGTSYGIYAYCGGMDTYEFTWTRGTITHSNIGDCIDLRDYPGKIVFDSVNFAAETNQITSTAMIEAERVDGNDGSIVIKDCNFNITADRLRAVSLPFGWKNIYISGNTFNHNATMRGLCVLLGVEGSGVNANPYKSALFENNYINATNSGSHGLLIGVGYDAVNQADAETSSTLVTGNFMGARLV